MSPNSTINILKRTIITAAIVLLFAPSIVMLSSTIFPFIFPKVIFMQIMIEILVGLYVLLVLADRSYLPRSSLILKAALVFIAIFFVAGFVGVDTLRSFWSNYERMSGAITLLHYTALIVIIGSVLRTFEEWEMLWRIAIFIHLIPIVAGLWQLVSPNFLLFEGGRIYGTFGNPIYLGGYAVFHLFLVIYLWIKGGARWRIFYTIIGLIDLLALVKSGTRGALVGFAVGFFIAAVIFSVHEWRTGERRWAYALMVAVIVLGGGLFALRGTSFIQSVPLIARITNFQIFSGTGATRLIAWQIAFKGFQARPVLGWGPENYFYVFNTFYDPRSLEYSAYETWFDHAHNTPLDILVTTGVVGLAAYLALYGAAFWAVWRIIRLRDPRYFFALAALGMIIAHFVQNVFVFDHPSSYLLFFLLLASVHGLSLSAKAKAVPKKLNAFAALAVGLVTILIVYNVNIPAVRANTLDLTAERSLRSDPVRALSEFREAVGIRQPYRNDTRMNLGREILYMGQYAQLTALPVYRELWNLATAELTKTVQEKPQQVVAALNLGQLYSLGTQWDGKYSPLAEQYFAQALEHSPRRQQIYYAWSKHKMAIADYAGAEKLLRQAIEDNPAIGQSYWFLSVVYAEQGRVAEALALYKEVASRKYTLNPTETVYAAGVYEKAKEYQQALTLLEGLVGQGWRDRNVYQSIIRLYGSLGDKTNAALWTERLERELGK